MFRAATNIIGEVGDGGSAAVQVEAMSTSPKSVLAPKGCGTIAPEDGDAMETEEMKWPAVQRRDERPDGISFRVCQQAPKKKAQLSMNGASDGKANMEAKGCAA